MNDSRLRRALAPVVLARALFCLNVAIWIAFDVVTLLRLAGSQAGPPITGVVIGVLMFGNAAAMLIVGLGLGRQRLFYALALALLAVNTVLTLTDEVGFFDWATLAIDLILLGLLIATRRSYFPRRQAASD